MHSLIVIVVYIMIGCFTSAIACQIGAVKANHSIDTEIKQGGWWLIGLIWPLLLPIGVILLTALTIRAWFRICVTAVNWSYREISNPKENV